MFKALFLALAFVVIVSPPGHAQAWTDSAGAGDTDGNTSAKTGSDEAFAKGRGYDLQSPGGASGGGWSDRGFAQNTGTQGMSGVLSTLRQTSNGAPVIIGGANTMLAPSNLALKTQRSGASLPKTNLDSFVHKSRQTGMAELIYGDEGVTREPPFSFFMPINTGINSGGLTTGHKSDAPSAWGTPLKYNSSGGVIRGQ